MSSASLLTIGPGRKVAVSTGVPSGSRWSRTTANPGTRIFISRMRWTASGGQSPGKGRS